MLVKHRERGDQESATPHTLPPGNGQNAAKTHMFPFAEDIITMVDIEHNKVLLSLPDIEFVDKDSNPIPSEDSD